MLEDGENDEQDESFSLLLSSGNVGLGGGSMIGTPSKLTQWLHLLWCWNDSGWEYRVL